MAENCLRRRNHFLDLIERPQRRAIQRIHRQVPRTQLCQLQLVTPLRLQFTQNRHDFTLNGVVETDTVVRGVIKPQIQTKGVVAVVRKAGVLRNLFAQFGELIEGVLKFFGFLQTPVGDQLPRLPSQRAVGLLQIAGHLRKGFLFAAKINRQ